GKRRPLGQIAHSGSRAERVARRVDAADDNPAPVRMGQSDDAPERCRLAGAIRAEQRNALAGRDLEADAVEHPSSAEGLGDAAQSQHWTAPLLRRVMTATRQIRISAVATGWPPVPVWLVGRSCGRVSGWSSAASARTFPLRRAATSSPAAAGL